jgi:hypothetical protein
MEAGLWKKFVQRMEEREWKPQQLLKPNMKQPEIFSLIKKNTLKNKRRKKKMKKKAKKEEEEKREEEERVDDVEKYLISSSYLFLTLKK